MPVRVKRYTNKAEVLTTTVEGGATRVRYAVLAAVCSLSVVSYLDRVCMSGSAPFITSELGLRPVEMGYVFSAFTLAYALFEVPSGWLGDTIGPRRVVTRIVLWWSAFTTLTGLMHRFWSMVTVRFLFGAGEAGTYPNTSKIISRWMPVGDRGFAQGLVWMSGRAGGALAPGLVVLMISHIGWRASFWVFGSVGVVWATFFWLWFRDTPKEKSGVNAAEIRIISGARAAAPAELKRRQVPWKRLLSSGNLWAICWMYFCMAYGWYFYITWLPTYLKARGSTMMEAGIYGGLPLLFGAVGCGLGGWLTDYAVRRTGNLRTRRYIGAAGFFLGALSMVISVRVSSPLGAVLMISMASFFGDLTMGSSWAVCLDVGHEFAGTVSGCMNTWGNLGGFVSPMVTGYVVEHLGNWEVPIVISGAIFFFGAILWLLIDPTESVLD
jgi:MFS transporter, ACS family, glucarate transporter